MKGGASYPGPTSPVGFDVWRDEFIERSFEWHLLSSQIIFGLVVAIVIAGVIVALAQFRADIGKNGISKDGEGDQLDGYDISASPTSISVKTKTIGAVLLIFSGLFFLLYLKYVYPVIVVNVDDVDRISVQNASPSADG